MASFRKKRYPVVAQRVATLLRQLSDASKSGNTSLKRDCESKLACLIFFDKLDFRVFLWKYIEFNKLVLDQDLTIPFDHVISEFEVMCLQKGVISALGTFKSLYGAALRISTGNSFEPLPYLKTYSGGEPKLLGPLLPLLKGTLNERRGALTALQLIKLVEQWGTEFGLKSIVQEPLIPKLPFDKAARVGNYFNRFMENKRASNINGVDLNRLRGCWSRALELMFPAKSRKERIELINKSSHIHISGRNGPNGPCLGTVVIDHLALAPVFRESALLKDISQLSNLTNNKDLNIILQNFAEEDYTVDYDKTVNTAEHSKISLKKEPFGRLRPFAIGDWFTHSSLRGFHDYLYRYLEAQPQDGTYKQDECSEVVKEWTMKSLEPKDSTESADLSSATDAIPLELQAEIVSQIAGEPFSLLWRRIMSDRSFKTPDGQYVKYNRGQPMGISSSWPMLAIWHHAVIRTALLYLGREIDFDQPQYFVIGDDSSMSGRQLFRLYETIVAQIMGVGISKQKGFHMDTRLSTHNLVELESIEGIPLHTAELAKRVFCNGQEITIVPPDEVYTSFEDPIQFKELLVSLKKRGYPELDPITKIPRLAALSRDKKLALLLATNPLIPAPQFLGGNLQLRGLFPYNSIYWFYTNRSEEEIYKEFFSIARGELIRTLGSATGLINLWIKKSMVDQDVKVTAWEYNCQSQGLVWFLVAERCKLICERALSRLEEMMKSQEPDSVNWIEFMKLLKSTIVIFDIERSLNGSDHTKIDEYKFKNTFVAKIVKGLIFKDNTSSNSKANQ